MLVDHLENLRRSILQVLRETFVVLSPRSGVLVNIFLRTENSGKWMLRQGPNLELKTNLFLRVR